MFVQGTYLILQREDSKRLQTLDQDEAVRAAVCELKRSKTYRDAGLVLECGDCWNAIHRCLSDGTLDPDVGEFPLNNLVLGGKRLFKGSGFYAVLVRPDIVPFVAESARDVKRSELRELYFNWTASVRSGTERKEFDRVWSLFRQIQQLFDDASADRAAVLFTAAPALANSPVCHGMERDGVTTVRQGEEATRALGGEQSEDFRRHDSFPKGQLYQSPGETRRAEPCHVLGSRFHATARAIRRKVPWEGGSGCVILRSGIRYKPPLETLPDER